MIVITARGIAIGTHVPCQEAELAFPRVPR
jgi:hypothetical protein